MKAPADTTTEKVPLISNLAFGADDIGPAIATAIMSLFTLHFFTAVTRLNPAVAGVILLISKLWDAINDPIVGMLSDKVQ